MHEAIRDPDAVAFILVDELPKACGGGVAYQERGRVWVLLEQGPPDLPDPTDDTPVGDWLEAGYRVLDAGELLTVADQATRFGVSGDVSLSLWWSQAWDWWTETVRERADS